MTDDDELLSAYTSRDDSEAFRRLIERYAPLVYAAARRQVGGGDAHLAEDVTQAVFILLARKARSVRGDALAGWLVNATRMCAKTVLRGEFRRRFHETGAADIHRRQQQASAEKDMPGGATHGFDELVDEALCRLNESDRTAVSLHYLHGKSQREVADTMGLSEDAVAKRLSRAMAKLRRFFGGRGTVLSVAGIIEAMHRLHVHAPGLPDHLVGKVFAAALQVGSVASAPFATAVAAEVASAMRRKIALTTTAVSSLVATLAAVVTGIVIAASPHGTGNGASQGQATSVVQGPIRAGVYVSAKTAMPRPPSDDAWYSQLVVVDEFKMAGGEIELIPLIEPNTAEQPQQKRLVAKYFPGKTPILITDTVGLRQLDAIVANVVHEPPMEALKSIEAAVSSGTGLLIRRCLGVCKPGPGNPVVARLLGLASVAPNLHTTRAKVDCVIAGDHPILGKLSGKTDVPIRIHPAGAWGKLPSGVGVPLIRLRSTADLAANSRLGDPSKTTGDLLYLSACGKGRVVVCNSWAVTPQILNDATDGRFMILCVKWLAGRPVE